jgi:hypothetical protein
MLRAVGNVAASGKLRRWKDDVLIKSPNDFFNASFVGANRGGDPVAEIEEL